MVPSVEPPHASAESELELAQRLLKQAGTSADYALSILEQLELPREAWPSCCGSSCDPCVGTLNRIALQVRAHRVRLAEAKSAEQPAQLGTGTGGAEVVEPAP
jgi:hypothetical protein